MRVARRLEDLPLIRAAFARGELSYSKVRAFRGWRASSARRSSSGSLATPRLPSSTASCARTGASWRSSGSRPAARRTLRQLDRGRRRLAAAARAAARGGGRARARSAGGRRRASLGGRHRAAARGGARARGRRRRRFRGSAQRVRSPRRRARADGRHAARERSGSADRRSLPGHRPRGRGDAVRRRGRRPLRDRRRRPLAVETARRLACDAAIVPMLEASGQPLDVGRKTRAIPPALRRALTSRDRGCRFPGCGERRFVDAHHVRHWAHGGETSVGNLVQLCRHHHRLLHEGGYAVEGDPCGELIFRRPDGRRVPAVPAPPPGCSTSSPGRTSAAGRPSPPTRVYRGGPASAWTCRQPSMRWSPSRRSPRRWACEGASAEAPTARAGWSPP